MATDMAEEATQNIATYLRHEAYLRSITQGTIAESAHLSRSAVNDYLRGKKEMRLPAFLDICAAIGVNPDDVLLRAVKNELPKHVAEVGLTEGRVA
jgi:transcriptional regulator with XRE-family HTH domain